MTAYTQPAHHALHNLGVMVGKMYTDHGLPVDMSLKRLNYSKQEKISILDGVCSWMIQHKKNSGATDKAIERQKLSNKTVMDHFISSGESGLY